MDGPTWVEVLAANGYAVSFYIGAYYLVRGLFWRAPVEEE